MKHIQIIDTEDCIKYADLKNSDAVYLLNRETENPIDTRIKTPPVSESFEPNWNKYPRMMTEVYNDFPPAVEDGENKNEFEIKIITRNKERFFSRVCICDESRIEQKG